MNEHLYLGLDENNRRLMKKNYTQWPTKKKQIIPMIIPYVLIFSKQQQQQTTQSRIFFLFSFHNFAASWWNINWLKLTELTDVKQNQTVIIKGCCPKICLFFYVFDDDKIYLFFF